MLNNKSDLLGVYNRRLIKDKENNFSVSVCKSEHRRKTGVVVPRLDMSFYAYDKLFPNVEHEKIQNIVNKEAGLYAIYRGDELVFIGYSTGSHYKGKSNVRHRIKRYLRVIYRTKKPKSAQDEHAGAEKVLSKYNTTENSMQNINFTFCPVLEICNNDNRFLKKHLHDISKKLIALHKPLGHKR